MNRRFTTQTTPSTPKLSAAHSEGSGTADSSRCNPQLFTVIMSPLFRSATNRRQFPFGLSPRKELNPLPALLYGWASATAARDCAPGLRRPYFTSVLQKFSMRSRPFSMLAMLVA